MGKARGGNPFGHKRRDPVGNAYRYASDQNSKERSRHSEEVRKLKDEICRKKETVGKATNFINDSLKEKGLSIDAKLLLKSLNEILN